jgi:hypothetical protein
MGVALKLKQGALASLQVRADLVGNEFQFKKNLVMKFIT